jgi:hypothetical protein
VTFDDARVGVGEVDLALRCRGQRVGVGRPSGATPVLHSSAAVVLVGAVGAHLAPQLFIQAPPGFLETLAAAARHRPRLLRALLLKPALGLAQPRPPPFPGAKLLGQFVAARISVELVLGGLDGLDFFSRPAYDPAMMVALLVYAYARGLRSSRVIERACEEDVAFRVLAAQ